MKSSLSRECFRPLSGRFHYARRKVFTISDRYGSFVRSVPRAYGRQEAARVAVFHVYPLADGRRDQRAPHAPVEGQPGSTNGRRPGGQRAHKRATAGAGGARAIGRRPRQPTVPHG